MSTIIQLTSQNVKRLKAVRIEPTETGLVIIGGNNAQGKTSVLDSITYNLGGTSTHCKNPIRNGEDRAYSELVIGDLIVKRSWTKSGSKLVVENKEGASFKSPQSILNKMLGPMSVDGMEFAILKPKEQEAKLRELIGIDTDDLDRERSELYDERTDVNRTLKNLEGQLSGLSFDPEIHKVDVSALLTQLTEANAHNSLKHDLEADSATAEARFKEIHQSVRENERRIDELEHALAEEKAKTAGLVKVEVEAQRCVDESSKAYSDFEEIPTVEIETKISEAESVNEQARKNTEYKDVEAKISTTHKASEDLTSRINLLDQKKRNLLASAKYPIEGLKFGEDGLYFHGVLLEQCSSAEKTRVSISLGLAMNPELKVLLIRDGSLLDEQNLAMVGEMASERGAQVWIERVGEADNAVIIEDGEVRD